MPSPACQYVSEDAEEFCNIEGFSCSADHENLWYCRKHYILWLKDKDFLKLRESLEKVKNDPRARKLLQEIMK